MKYTITTNDGTCNNVTNTDGYVLVYLAGQNVKFSGTIDLKALTPLLTKILLEKMVK